MIKKKILLKVIFLFLIFFIILGIKEKAIGAENYGFNSVKFDESDVKRAIGEPKASQLKRYVWDNGQEGGSYIVTRPTSGTKTVTVTAYGSFLFIPWSVTVPVADVATNTATSNGSSASASSSSQSNTGAASPPATLIDVSIPNNISAKLSAGSVSFDVSVSGSEIKDWHSTARAGNATSSIQYTNGPAGRNGRVIVTFHGTTGDIPVDVVHTRRNEKNSTH